MDNKTLCLNVRKAYRLVYEVQDSIIDAIEYIRSKIRYQEHAGRQLFSDPIEKCRSPIGGEADQKFGEGRWSWDYFPSFMYMYYFSGKQERKQNYSFSITQVMDDGFKSVPESDSSPSTEQFKDPAESDSYFLFAFSSWHGSEELAFYDDESDTENNDGVAEKIREISETIKVNGFKPYIRRGTGTIIVMRVSFEVLGSRDETYSQLKQFAQLVEQEVGYSLLLTE